MTNAQHGTETLGEEITEVAQEVVEAAPAVIGLSFAFAGMVALLLFNVGEPGAGRIALYAGVALLVIEGVVFVLALGKEHKARR